MVYVEVGLGLPYLVSTETEHPDGSEERVRGIEWPARVRSAYLRVQARTLVVVLDLRTGLKVGRKPYRAWKLALGLTGES